MTQQPTLRLNLKAGLPPPKGKPGAHRFAESKTESLTGTGPLGPPTPSEVFLTVPPAVEQCLPLKIGSHNSVFSRCRHSCSIGTALGWLRHHVGTESYLKAMAGEDAWRYDLDGRPVEPVSAAHREHARERLAALIRPAAPPPPPIRRRRRPPGGAFGQWGGRKR